MTRLPAVLLTAAVSAIAAPALADHGIASTGVSGSGPILTQDVETLPAGTLAGGLSLRVNVPDAYTDAELIALAADHVHSHTTDYDLGATASLAYGVTGHFTLSAALPFVHRDDLRAGEHSHTGGGVSNTVEPLGSVSGVGDLTLMGQYQFAHSHADGWGVALLAGLKLPTGSTGKTDPAGIRLETEHQPGTGSWDPLIGLAAAKRWGAASLHGSALYQVSTEGAQDTELGDRVNLSAAVVYNLARAAEHAHDGGEVHSHGPASSWALMLETNYERERRQRIAGIVEPDSGGETLWLSPDVRFSAASGWFASISAGVPVWQDIGLSHPENRYRALLQVGSAF